MVTGDALVRLIDAHATAVVTRQTQALRVSVVASGTLGDTAAEFLHKVEVFVTRQTVLNDTRPFTCVTRRLTRHTGGTHVILVGAVGAGCHTLTVGGQQTTSVIVLQSNLGYSVLN